MACKGGKDAQQPQQRKGLDPYRVTFHEAMQEKMRGNLDVAAVLFEKCLTYNDNADAVHFALSDLYQQLGVVNKPLEHALRAFDIDKENRWYQLRLANLYFQGGNYHKSAEYFELAIEEERNLDVKFKYAESLIYSNQFKKAIGMMNEIEVETGKLPHLSLTKHDMYLQMGDNQAAAKELSDLIESDPNNLENRLVMADYFLRTQQEQKAEKIANEALQIAPNSGELRLILADLEIRKGNLDKCFVHLNLGFKQEDVSLSRKVGLIGSLQAYAFDGSDDGETIQAGLGQLYEIIYDEEAKNDTLHSQYGYFLQMQNKPQEANAQYKKVVEINPASFDSWLQLIYGQFNIEDYPGMYESAKEAIELFPAQPTIWMMAGISAYETGKFEDAEEWLYYGEGIVVKDPSLSAEFVHQKGVLAWRQKDYESAHKYFDESKELDLYNGNVYYSKALCYIEEGKEKEALAEVEDALNNAPKNAFFYDLKGLVYFEAGKYDEAKKAFDMALTFEADNAKFIEHYGDLLYKMGETEKAIERWKQSMELGGYTPVLEKKLKDGKYYEQ